MMAESVMVPGFLQGVRGKDIAFVKGDRITADGLYYVLSGQIAVLCAERTEYAVGAGEFFGESTLFAKDVPVTAVAEKNGQMIHYPTRSVLLHLRVHADLSLAFSAHMVRQLDWQRRLAQILRIKAADQRILSYFHLLGAAEQPVHVTEPLSDLAHRLGLTHEALYRTLSRLHHRGALRRLSRHCFQIPLKSAIADPPPDPAMS